MNANPTSPMTACDILLRDHQGAPMLGCAPQTLRRWRSEALRGQPLQGPLFLRVGRSSVRYRLADVRDYLAERAADTKRELGVGARPGRKEVRTDA